jgi:hypothetical protein
MLCVEDGVPTARKDSEHQMTPGKYKIGLEIKTTANCDVRPCILVNSFK